MKSGQKIRDYILEKRIGVGGVGEVWRAYHERLNKPVAIKLILPHLCLDQNIYDRFVQEAIATANLEHPHIVSVFDFFSADDSAFLVMSYIEGGSLQDRLKNREQIPIDEALHISRGILDALDFAHQRGVIHRDVKPSNILVTSDSHAYLVDFGIALVLGKTRVTKFGTNVGTPEYMSPEQIRGETLDHHTDVYSFGCVLYEMIAGRPPFGSSDEEGVTDFSIMERHIKNRPTPLRKLNSKVDEKTESVVMTAMAKDRYDRFSGCAEMAKALIVPAGISTGSRAPAKTSRALKVVVGILAMSTLVFAIGWMSTYYSPRSEEIIQLENKLKEAKLEKDLLIQKIEKLRQQEFKKKLERILTGKE